MKQKDTLETYRKKRDFKLQGSRLKRSIEQKSCRPLKEIAYLLVGGLLESFISLTDGIELLWRGADYVVDFSADLLAGLRRRYGHSHNDSSWTELPQCGNCGAH